MKLVVALVPLLIFEFANFVFGDTFGSGANTFDVAFVTVGNPGNPADTTGAPNPAGSVSYVYRMGKYEVSEEMIDKANLLGGLGITKDNHHADQPVHNVNWNQAARFVNWLNTSTGSVPAYKFAIEPGQVGYSANANIELWSPADSGYNPSNLYRNSLARYYLPSVDEWYKAAYYDPTINQYYYYPGTNSIPLDVIGGTAAGTAVFDGGPGFTADITLAASLTPYGTLGQGGNVREWQETSSDLSNSSASSDRIYRGGDVFSNSIGLRATTLHSKSPTTEFETLGLRVASAFNPDDIGDFNHDGVVDVADYVVWRKSNGTQTDYNVWRANFGINVPGVGSSTTYSAIPEPSTVLLAASIFALFAICRRSRC